MHHREASSGSGPASTLEATLRDVALGYPETAEEFPWGDRVIKVRGKIFVFLGAGQAGFAMSVKLPRTGEQVLLQSYAKPTGYGLGKSGWVSLSFEMEDAPPTELLRDLIDESYRAVAPKKLVATLEDRARA